eukprot:TRINITY_DN44449_c0_g1_i1.p1 TRINITY_DN44449_c0_g1~~TRINITY_DN44449_c0_g1_i1.p1  ORF type:complete len:163 (+),score=22.01 TRINITY_DN44449_c0_g1_i1:232-720(+)
MRRNQKRGCRDVDASTVAAVARKRHKPIHIPPTLRVLIVHANNKPYGRGAVAPAPKSSAERKAQLSNATNFSFSAADYLRMRDAGRPYSGDPRANKLLPLPCLLYTSDAADEEDSVDLGGRRIIKKKKNEVRRRIYWPNIMSQTLGAEEINLQHTAVKISNQ